MEVIAVRSPIHQGDCTSLTQRLLLGALKGAVTLGLEQAEPGAVLPDLGAQTVIALGLIWRKGGNMIKNEKVVGGLHMFCSEMKGR